MDRSAPSDHELDAGVSNADPRMDHVSLTTLLVLRLLAYSKVEQSDDVSSASRRVLMERILQKFSSASNAAKLDNIVIGTFAEVLQGSGREGALHSSLDPQDTTFDKALMDTLQKCLDAEASQASPAVPKMMERDDKPKKRKSVSNLLRKVKINIFKKKSNKVMPYDEASTADLENLPSCSTAVTGESSSATSQKEKPRKHSILYRMLSIFKAFPNFAFPSPVIRPFF